MDYFDNWDLLPLEVLTILDQLSSVSKTEKGE